MSYDFDRVVERHGTNSLKYDFAAERGYPKDILPFWVADMDFPAPPEVIDELVRRSQHGIFGYTDAKSDYIDVLQRWFSAHHHWRPSADSLIITPGVVFAICAAVRAFTQPGDAVMLQQPVYYPFFSAIQQNGRKLIDSPLKLHDGHYAMDFADIEQKIKDAHVKLLLLCSPQNPTGRVWRKEELERLGAICQKHRVIVVADEIHEDFVRRGFRHMVFASLSPDIDQLTITCTAPSKTFNLAGLQLSNVFIANASLRRRFCHEIHAAGYSQPNALGLFAAQAAYAHGTKWLEDLLAYLEQNLQKAKAFLARELPKIRVIEPEGTYLLWLDFRAYGMGSEELDRRIIEQAHLWLDSGSIFGDAGKGFQRINIACPWVTLEKGLQQVKQAFG